jgi:hypothetical protein
MINEERYFAAMERIASSALLDAMSTLLTSPHSDYYTLKPGDSHEGYEATEREYVTS